MPSVRKNAVWLSAKLFGRVLGIVKPYDVENLARLAGRRRQNTEFQRLLFFAKTFVSEFEGMNYSISENGEKQILQALSELDVRTIFDVGANVGNWSRIAFDAHPNAQIHAFEIVGETRNYLSENLRDARSRISIEECGLSDADGELDVFYAGGGSATSSIYAPQLGGEMPQRCKVKKGDTFCRDQRIERIDFLKLDVEGAEARVLRGFEGMFARKAIRVCQFEYNRGAIVSRFLLCDFYEFFARFGYIVGKLYPEGVLFRPYSLELEDFSGPNYIACHKDDQPVLERIRIAQAPAGLVQST